MTALSVELDDSDIIKGANCWVDVERKDGHLHIWLIWSSGKALVTLSARDEQIISDAMERPTTP
jgi:hypothetical protein